MLNPGGGPKDTSPPRVVKYMPDSAATNFKGKEINISFDEYIQLKDLNTQLIVSPPVETQPEVKLVKNKIINIEFREPLKDNTTYTINFGNAIADITEGNVKENFRYVFSTGNYIDSISLTGSVMYAQDLKPEKNVLVMLYSDLSDSAVFKHKPDYFAKTKADGTFQVSNIKTGKYKVVAVKDEDGNYLYTPVTEYIAFADSLIDLQKNKKINLYLFKEKYEKLFLLHQATGYGNYTMIFSRPVEKVEITGFNKTDTKSFIKELKGTQDTVTYWFPNFTDDSIQFYVGVNGQRFDTVSISGASLKNKKTKAVEKLDIKTNIIPGQSFDLNKDIILIFNHPIQTTNNVINTVLVIQDTSLVLNTGLFLKKDALRIYRLRNKKNNYISTQNITTGDIITDSINFNLLKPDANSQLMILPGAFTDIFGLTHDSIKIVFKTQEQKYYGTLKVKLTAKTGEKKIVQLLDEKGNVVRSDLVGGNKDLFYEYLHPKNYKIRVIYDENGNDRWDTGNFLKHQQPEKVIYYTLPITVRSNWDLEIEWEIK